MSISKICQISDIHIRKSTSRNNEYQLVFEKLIKSLTRENPDRIVIVGDLVHDYLDLQGEQLIIAHNLLLDLCKIAPVRITRGNHDCIKKNLKRVDSVKAIVNTLGDVDIIYYDKTGFYFDDNIIWAVWHHGEKDNNPWKTRDGKKILAYKPEDGYKTIDLFHDPITGCKSTTNFEMKSKSYYKISEFKGNFSMFGDIHRMQYLDDEKTKAYSGSLIAQDFSEGDDSFHGYLLWNINDSSHKEISIDNEFSFKNIKISQFIDFDDLDFDVSNPTTYMKIRFIWATLPQARTKENERKIVEYIKSKYSNITISHKNEFLETDNIEISDAIVLENIIDNNVQHEIFKEYLTKIGAEEQLINDVIALDEEILREIDISSNESVEWNIIKFGGKNFMSYETIDIDWRELNGLFQITGDNTTGKTTILKLLTYIFFGKTLETDSRMKFGDQRFINNRNNAAFCDGYSVIEANGQYYGIKRRTEINRNKANEITGVPTILSYYLLSSPDDDMDDDSALEKLDEDRRVKTQKIIDSIIGSYDNFIRVVMTTSDTLNKILSNDMATFIDTLLYDSGLDIFDKKLEGHKSYQNRINEKSRINCNVEATTAENIKLIQSINDLSDNITNLETNKLPEIQNKINIGRKYIEDLAKKLYKIDDDIYGLNLNDVINEISNRKKNIDEFNLDIKILTESIEPLAKTYDEVRLSELNILKDEQKTNEYNNKLIIKEFEQKINNEQHQIEIINGDIFRLKSEGLKYKTEIHELKNCTICPTCGQKLVSDNHQHNINDKILTLEKSMYGISDNIKNKENVDKLEHQKKIETINLEILNVKNIIVENGLKLEAILTEIGAITNDKNDVEKRKELQTKLDLIPMKIQNEQLMINILDQKRINYDNNLLQINENQKIENNMFIAKNRINQLVEEEKNISESVFLQRSEVIEKQFKLKTNEMLILDFKAQEYRDVVNGLYKKCVHRDGIPRQMLVNYIIPKINLTLEKILSVSSFKIWLDLAEIRPKLAYSDRPTSIIDCISASGKERTFSSIVLKFALNQINVKAKPTIFLLDEVMGKLDQNSVDEFIEILQLIKNNMNKVLIIEHNANLNPDHLIDCQLDENGISSMSIE